jgi:hypothetical protein
MKARNLTLSALGLIALAFVAAAPIRQAEAQKPTPKPTKWEYKCYYFDQHGGAIYWNKEVFDASAEKPSYDFSKEKPVLVQDLLNQLGEEGWELISYETPPGGVLTALLKRPKQ